jgi:hypothetical protein
MRDTSGLLSSPAPGSQKTPTPSSTTRKRQYRSPSGNTDTSSKKAQNAKKSKENNTDMAEAPTLATKPEQDWRDEIGTPMQWLELNKRSATFDISDPWWQNMFIKHTGLAVDKSLQRQAGRGSTNVKDLTKQYETVWENDDAGLDPNVEAEPETSPNQAMGHQPEFLNDLAALLQEGSIWADELEQHQKANLDMEKNGEHVDSNDVKVSGMATVIEPTQVHVDILAEQDRWADDPDLQCDNIEEATKNLRIPPLTQDGTVQQLKMPEMRHSVALEAWQPLAANAMHDSFKDPLLVGHLNADDVGLGKTIETIAFLLRVSGCIVRLFKISPGC